MRGALDESVVGVRADLHGLLEQAVEQLAPRSRAAIETKGEFVKVIGQVLVAYCSLMSPEQPPFQQGRDAMHAR